MRIATLLMLTLALSGCPFAGITQLNRIPQSEALSEPVLFNRPGVLQHETTGFEFPEWYDNFHRVTAYRYDTAGLDISVGYNDRRSRCVVVAKFFVYPAPRMTFFGASPSVVASLQERWLRDEFARSRAEIEAAFPSMGTPSVSSSSTLIRGSLANGPFFRFSESENLSELRLFIYDRQWFLKYRFTYPKACQSEATERIDSLIEKLPWAST